MKRHVIIGNSGAGVSAAQAIRQVSSQDTITLVSRENCLAYSPVLITYYLSGKIHYRDIFFCDEAFYQHHQVRTLFGRKAIKIDPGAHKVLIEPGQPVEYDDLLVATGSSTMIPPIEGVTLPGIFAVYSAEDATRLIENLKQSSTVAIVGTGLIGMQTLTAVLARGKKAVLIEMQEQVMPRILDLEGAGIIENKLRQEGVDLHLNDRVTRIITEGNQKGLLLASGNRVKAEVVVMAAGVKPNIDLLHGSGVRVGNGVVIDEHCRTNIEGIYAAGDVAESIDAITGESLINASWPNAIEQGTVAGFNMAGQNKTCRSRPRFNVLTFFDLSCASVGLTRADGENVVEYVQRGDNYRKLIFRDGFLIGAVLFGDIEDAGILASLMERKVRFANPEKVWHLTSPVTPYITGQNYPI